MRCSTTTACAEAEKATILHLFDGFALERSSIRWIEVLDHELVSALSGISTELQLADTVLFLQEPIETIPVAATCATTGSPCWT
ncbi:MAG: hypothetical protein ABIQ75_00460 [Flavobacteriales bacterium]